MTFKRDAAQNKTPINGHGHDDDNNVRKGDDVDGKNKKKKNGKKKKEQSADESAIPAFPAAVANLFAGWTS